MRVLSILVRHGETKYPDAELQLDSIFKRQLPGVNRAAIIVDNALPAEFMHRAGVTTVIGGDNCAWEFSAWNKALRWLGDEIWSYDLIHLVTSAFHTLYTKYLYRFSRSMLDAVIERPVCLGHVDCYNEPVRIQTFTSQHWVRTSFLFLPPAELAILKDMVSLKRAEEWFGNSPDQAFSGTAKISKNYQTYVLDWLTGSDIGQGSMWHSKIALDAESWSMFKAKATAIFNEHLFSIRLRAQGTYLIDTTWLATMLDAAGGSAIDWNTSWRRQLAERDTDPILLQERL